MGRIRRNIEVAGKSCWTLFDTGARNTYVIEKVAAMLPTFELKIPGTVSLGGKAHIVRKDCRLEALIDGLPILTHARVIDEIGKDEENKAIEILIGALTMQEWGIRLIPEEERLDLTYYPKEFVEYL